jgi:hypothetical protein
MTYNSKKNVIGMAAGIIVVAIYIAYAFVGNTPAQGDIQEWAKLILIFIGIGVAAQIVIQIIFHIAFAISIAAKEHAQGRTPDENVERKMSAEMIEDERDKLISLKSSRIGNICAGVGIMIAFFALAGGAPVVIALHIIIGSFAAGSLIEGCTGIYFHERGVRNGR